MPVLSLFPRPQCIPGCHFLFELDTSEMMNSSQNKAKVTIESPLAAARVDLVRDTALSWPSGSVITFICGLCPWTPAGPENLLPCLSYILRRTYSDRCKCQNGSHLIRHVGLYNSQLCFGCFGRNKPQRPQIFL